MAETNIKKLNLKALAANSEEKAQDSQDKMEGKASISTGVETHDVSCEKNLNKSNIKEEKVSSQKISIWNIKKSPTISLEKKQQEEKKSSDNTLISSAEDIMTQEEKNIWKQNAKTNWWEKSIINKEKGKSSIAIKEDKIKERNIQKEWEINHGMDASSKNIPIATNTEKEAWIDTKNINENFKDKKLSKQEEDEIISKTLQAEKKEKKKWFFRKLFKRAKKKEKVKDSSPENKEIHFNNYTSDFEKKSKNIFKRVQNFKYAPKTRKWLILWLISFTVIIISGLMIIYPEKHSISIYKASILDIINKEWTQNIQQEIQETPISHPPQVSPPIEEEVPKTEEKPKNEEVHRKEENKEKLRNYLLERYKK